MGLGKTNFGVQYAQGDNTVAVSTSAKDVSTLGQAFACSFFRKINPSFNAAAEVTYNAKATNFRAGFAKEIDSKSSFRGYVNQDYVFRGNYAYQLTDRLNAAAKFQFNFKNPADIQTGFKLDFN